MSTAAVMVTKANTTPLAIIIRPALHINSAKVATKAENNKLIAMLANTN
jgi:hypothetical protein